MFTLVKLSIIDENQIRPVKFSHFSHRGQRIVFIGNVHASNRRERLPAYWETDLF